MNPVVPLMRKLAVACIALVALKGCGPKTGGGTVMSCQMPDRCVELRGEELKKDFLAEASSALSPGLQRVERL